MKNQQSKISKFLSYVLRHRPDAIGLDLDKNGWADILELIECAQSHGKNLSREIILDVVKNNDKQRFKLSPDNTKIRASQGHSIDIDLQLQPLEPPEVLFHGTASRFLKSILANGLHSASRQHVHLSESVDTAMSVGKRYGKPVILKILSKVMHHDGCIFYRSDNGVWLTEIVAINYIEKVGT